MIKMYTKIRRAYKRQRSVDIWEIRIVFIERNINSEYFCLRIKIMIFAHQKVSNFFFK